ncbi:Serpentine type 7TM GPCR chemoreceptor Srsx [Cichlidogyrus casuarinus]|uniref:Serpentine type 7TM GPCR chemoreceptor Srsx n=1 Tax=Cichlidogyrus casuarinus TaxID=1844966 RepID=A0ABD2PQF2_9PLAT
MLVIAADRFRMIVYPLKKNISTVTASCICLSCLVLAAVIIFPSVYYAHPYRGPLNTTEQQFIRESCIERWPSLTYRMRYSIAIFLCFFLLPIIASGILYLLIALRIASRSVSRAALTNRVTVANLDSATVQDDNNNSNPRSNRRQYRTYRILIGIMTTYTVCMAPLMIYSLHLELGIVNLFNSLKYLNFLNHTNPQDYVETEVELSKVLSEKSRAVHLSLFTLSLVAACINPFLYGWMNEKARNLLSRDCCRLFSPNKIVLDNHELVPSYRMIGEQKITKSGSNGVREQIEKTQTLHKSTGNVYLGPSIIEAKVSLQQFSQFDYSLFHYLADALYLSHLSRLQRRIQTEPFFSRLLRSALGNPRRTHLGSN